jgi:predicted component of type VI protein secretion system
MNVKLVVLNAEHHNREIPLPRKIFLIGRDAKCNLRPRSPLVSRRHCAIAVWAGRVKVRDLKSANGTFVNDERIVGEVKVKHGDRLQVGNLVFSFSFPEEMQELQEMSPEVPEVVQAALPDDPLEWLMGPRPEKNGPDSGVSLLDTKEIHIDE